MTTAQMLLAYGPLGMFALYFVYKDYKLSKRVHMAISECGNAIAALTASTNNLVKVVERHDSRLERL